jgi:hypothetical protein
LFFGFATTARCAMIHECKKALRPSRRQIEWQTRRSWSAERMTSCRTCS